jgi:hypothetical protein
MCSLQMFSLLSKRLERYRAHDNGYRSRKSVEEPTQPEITQANTHLQITAFRYEERAENNQITGYFASRRNNLVVLCKMCTHVMSNCDT